MATSRPTNMTRILRRPSAADDLIVELNTNRHVNVKAVGGKALSLIRLSHEGFNVPEGIVLSVRFFDSWIDSVVTSKEWVSAVEYLQACSKRGSKMKLEQLQRLEELCGNVRAFASCLAFNVEQQRQIDAIMAQLGLGPYAVRSSSPEEDLEGSSFAGLYETVLDVDDKSLVDAIRTCFLSCLNHRVLVYKLEMGMENIHPSIAVITQCMIESKVAGVAFSISPLTNDYDELFINASWGLGERLVSGEVSPDAVIFNKFSNEIVSYRVGDKGGDRSEEKSLSKDQVKELADAVMRVESTYELPVDVEFAFDSNGKLHLLQARPMTTYIPLPEDMMTPPCAPRHLYLDNYLRKGVTMSEAVTPMSDDIMETLARLLFGPILGVPPEKVDLHAGGTHFHSRGYIDISMYLHLINSRKISKLSDSTDTMIAKVLSSPEINKYAHLEDVPSYLGKFHLLCRLPGLLWRGRRLLTTLYGPWYHPDIFCERLERSTEEFDKWIARSIDYSQSVRDCLQEETRNLGKVALESSYPALLTFVKVSLGMKSLASADSPNQRRLVDDILGGHEGDMVVDMGIQMFDMARLLKEEQFDDIEALAEKLKNRQLPPAFLELFEKFVKRYGVRGPLEMEIANEKYGEDPTLALKQIATVAKAGDEFNPRDMQSKRIAKRRRAYEELLGDLPPRKAKRLKTYYGLYNRYAAVREIPKHAILQVYARVRSVLLQRADKFIQEGRIDRKEDIFQLHMDDVDKATTDPSLDLRSLVQERGSHYRKLKRHVRHFPLFIDSRGRIIRIPPTYDKGALVGTAMSAGKARGCVKVLNNPSEKEVNPGDVIVAVATDPGWTPLFIGASAILLEVGGELQHGALIAREYGKPCVSGIANITSHFRDGQVVEVDGDTGLVRFIEK